MEAKAIQRHIGVPATKVRLVIDQIRGKPVEEALAILRFSTRPVARVVEKTLRSAVANALVEDEDHPVDAEELFVSRIFADEGRTLKRLRPRARGAAFRVRKRQSHMTVFVSDGVAHAVAVDEKDEVVEATPVSEE